MAERTDAQPHSDDSGMNVNQPPQGQPDAPSQTWDEDQPVEQAKSLFVTLGKAFRAFQLYDANNPVRQRFVEALRGGFRTIWEEVDRLVLRVTEDRILLGEVPVYEAASRNESLAFLFFKDGVREIAFTPGIEGEELERFLGILQKARKLVPEGDDLLTVLWQEDLQHFEYQYIDLLAEGVELPQPGGGHDARELQAVLQAETAAEEGEDAQEAAASGQAAEPGPATVSKDDFNPTLYALDPREMEILAGELRKELQRDVRADVLNALFDRLEEPENRARQSEILDILRMLLPSFLSRGQLSAATAVLQELGQLERMEGVFDEQRLAESRAILDEISTPETIEELIRALYDGTIRTSAAQLGQFLQYLRGGALPALLRASETVDHKELQSVLRESVKGIAARNRGALVALLQESDPLIAAGAARLAGEMQVTEAGPALAGLLAHPDPAVRLAAVDAAVSLKASMVAGALVDTLDDPERDVRIAAARALGTLRYTPAADALEDIITGKEIRNADIAEKIAFFEAFGLVAGEAGVRTLDGLLSGKRFLGKREPTEIRAAAALGLGKIPGPAARAALQKAADDDDPVVRSNVGRALRGEEAS